MLNVVGDSTNNGGKSIINNIKINKNKIYLYGFGILLLVAINYFAGADNKNKFQNFYDADIYGRIDKIDPHKGAVDITVHGKTFTFMPTFVDDSDFQFFAKVGDSVLKRAKSDTLKLIHKQKTYPFTFAKL